MSAKLWARLVLTALALSQLHCFATDPPDGAYACGAVPPGCPSGYHCASDQTCWRDGHGIAVLAGKLGGGGYADGVGAAARFGSPFAIAIAAAGDAYVADRTNSVLRKIDAASGAVSLVAGQPGVPGSTDGSAGNATFSRPSVVVARTTATDVELYVADPQDHTIRKALASTGFVSTVAGAPQMSGSADGTGASARFKSPWACAVAGAALYVADSGNQTIRKIDLTNNQVTTIAGHVGVAGSTDGPIGVALFNNPSGLAWLSDNVLLVTDRGNYTIRRIDLGTGQVSTLVGVAGQTALVDGVPPAARLYDPAGLASDDNGSVYFVDAALWIRRLDLAKLEVTTLAGNRPPGSADGSGAAAQFRDAGGIAYGGGRLLVADSGNFTVREVTLAGAVTTLAGLPSGAGSTDDRASAARFSRPNGITSDGADHLYVADSGNNAVRRVLVSTGDVQTVAGGSLGSADGTGPAARFNGPSDVVLVGGDLFVTDTQNHTIRRIALTSGAVTTLAGVAGAMGSADGVATARFNQPIGITADAAGRLYVADSGNSTLRSIVIATGEVSTLAGMAGSCKQPDGPANLATFCGLQDVLVVGNGLLVSDGRGVHRIALDTLGVSTVTDAAGAPLPLVAATGLTAGPDGSLFVADGSLHTIVRLAGGQAQVWAGTTGQARVDLGARPGSLNEPVGLALLSSGALAVTDEAENAVLTIR
jgi:sugar lactone lactonase YvrE